MRANVALLAGTTLLVLAVGCGGDSTNNPLSVGVNGSLAGVSPDVDTDMDGVPDVVEGTADVNGNDYPAHRDPTEGGGAGTTTGGTQGDGTGAPVATTATSGNTSTSGGTTAGGGAPLPTGSPCTPGVDTCAEVSLGPVQGIEGCCTSAGVCGGVNMFTGSGECVSSMMCDPSSFIPCIAENPCCTPDGGCGELEADGVTCTETGGLTGGITGGTSGGTTGGASGFTGGTTGGTGTTTGDGGAGTGNSDGACPDYDSQMLGMTISGCCAASGECGIDTSAFGGGGGCTSFADIEAAIGMSLGEQQSCSP